MQTLVVAAVIAAVAVIVATSLRSRRPDPPTQTTWGVPEQLDRSDFADTVAPWLVATFTSATCDACASMIAKVELLRSDSVSVDVVNFQDRPQIHRRYSIDAVPTTVLADLQGVVVASFVGPVSATDLWAAVAEAREPGSTPPPEAHHHDR